MGTPRTTQGVTGHALGIANSDARVPLNIGEAQRAQRCLAQMLKMRSDVHRVAVLLAASSVEPRDLVAVKGVDEGALLWRERGPAPPQITVVRLPLRRASPPRVRIARQKEF